MWSEELTDLRKTISELDDEIRPLADTLEEFGYELDSDDLRTAIDEIESGILELLSKLNNIKNGVLEKSE